MQSMRIYLKYYFVRKLSNLKGNYIAAPLSIPSSSSRISPSDPTALIIPEAPIPCDRSDFLDVGWWTRKDWVSFVEKQRVNGSGFRKLQFITDEDGTMVSNEWLAAISKEARLLWVSLYKKRQDPKQWGMKSKFASDYFSNSMRIKFEEFQWCEGDWKIEAFATIRYPDWISSRDGGTLTRLHIFSWMTLLKLLIYWIRG